MKILLISLGTRGDIEPFLAQAERLKVLGHKITCLFPEQFRELVMGLGYDFRGLDRQFLEMLDSKVGKSVMAGDGGFVKKARDFVNLIQSSFKMQSTLIAQQKEAIDEVKPDRVLYHPKAIYCILPAIVNPDRYFLLSPLPCLVHPSEEFPHLGLAKWKPFSAYWNLKSYELVNRLRYLTIRKFLKPYFKKFPEQNFSNQQLKEFERYHQKTIYQISPTLFSKPGFWPETAQIVGHFSRNQKKDYSPDTKLLDWLDHHPKAILLTFGSMTNPKPKELSQKILGLLEKYHIPTIVNLSWGGLEKIKGLSDRIFFVNQIPYDWILPQLYGMIHHGGSGTTHSGAKSGAVQLIIPHIMDQYFWNRLIFNQKIGPLGTSIHNFDVKKFEIALKDFWKNPEYKPKALKLSDQMKSEEDYTRVLNFIFPIT